MQRVSVTCKVWTENKSWTPWHPPQGPKVRSVRRCCVLSLSLRRGEMPSWCWLQRCLCQLEAGDRGHANSHCVIVCRRRPKGYGFGNSYQLGTVLRWPLSFCTIFTSYHIAQGLVIDIWSYLKAEVWSCEVIIKIFWFTSRCWDHCVLTGRAMTPHHTSDIAACAVPCPSLAPPSSQGEVSGLKSRLSFTDVHSRYLLPSPAGRELKVCIVTTSPKFPSIKISTGWNSILNIGFKLQTNHSLGSLVFPTHKDIGQWSGRQECAENRY